MPAADGPVLARSTVLYQFGHRDSFAPATFAPSGASPVGVHPNIDAWLTDIRAATSYGPLLIEGLAMYTTVTPSATMRWVLALGTAPSTTSSRSLGHGLLGRLGSSLTSLGIDTSMPGTRRRRIAYPGVAIGWDKYGRMQLASRLPMPHSGLSFMAVGTCIGARNDRDGSVAVAGTGITRRLQARRPRQSWWLGFGSDRFARTSSRPRSAGVRRRPGVGKPVRYMFMGPALERS